MTGTLLLQNFTPSQNDLILWEPLKYLDGAICKHSNPWFSFCNTVPTVQTSCCQYPNNTMTDLSGMSGMQGHHCIHTKWKSLSALGGTMQQVVVVQYSSSNSSPMNQWHGQTHCSLATTVHANHEQRRAGFNPWTRTNLLSPVTWDCGSTGMSPTPPLEVQTFNI